VLVAGLSVAAPAGAVPTCTFDEPTATVTVEVGESETATIARSGDAITLDATPCDVATVLGTDAIVVNGTGTPAAVVIDLTGGPFAPGLTPEPDPSSEIEFTIALPTGTPLLRVLGGPGPDDIVAGTTEINLNAGESADDADVLIVGLPFLMVEGGPGEDRLSVAGGSGTGGPSLGHLDGGADNDLLFGATGPNTITGGEGIDTVDYTAASQLLLADLLTATVQHGSGQVDVITSVENLTGSPGADTIAGTDEANVLLGGDGNDTLRGEGGDDLLDGGAGVDTVDLSTSPAPVRVVLAGRSATGDGNDRLEGIENATGSAFADQLVGDDGANRLDGLDGNDRIEGAGGDDHLDGGAGIDTVDFGLSKDGVTVNLKQGTATGAGTDTVANFENVSGSSGDDTIDGNAGPNTLGGGDGDDTIEGGSGDDRIKGGSNADRLLGQAGNDVLTAGPGFDQLNGGKGNGDHCRGGAEADSFVFCESLTLN
jgi:Ca2+-binding RTX toxin-like protein